MREKLAGGGVIFEAVDPTQEQFDGPILWLLAGMLFFMPAAFGSWAPWSESIAQAAACGLAVLLALKLTRRPDVPFVWSWTYLPIVLFFIFAVFQLIPLPAGWVGAISPKTLATHHALMDDLPDAAERLKHLRINFYEEGAWHDLRNLVAVTCVFVVVINVFRRAEQMIQLLWVIAWVGAAEGSLSILQNLTDAKDFYWLVPVTWGDASGGSFPNHNCFAQFMNLSSGAMVALLLLKIDRTFHRRDYTPAEVVEKLTSPDFRNAWILLGLLTISVASVFLSLSRGGMLSIAVAGITVGALLALRGGSRGMGIGGWFAGVILVAVFAIVMAGGAHLVEGRIAQIGNRDDRYDRYQLTKDTLRAWKDYPAVGMGLGSFRYTFPSYDRSDVVAIATHAEDEYAQLLEETGVVGALIAGSFLIMIFANFLRARARGKRNHDNDQNKAPDQEDEDAQEPGREHATASGSSHRHHSGRHRHSGHVASPASSLALGLCFGLVAILAQSCVDFGQHCISIASLTAISCALLINLASLRRRERGLEAQALPVHGLRLVRAGSLALIAIVSALLLLQANSVRLAKAAFLNADSLRAQLAAAGWKGDQGDFIDMNRFGDDSIRIRPNDMQYQYWRALNRFNTISDVRDPVTGGVLLTDEKRKILIGLAADLQRARWACPLYGPLYCQLGQWDRNSLDQLTEGAHYIRMAFELAPGDSVACFVMAMLDAEEGKWPDSVIHFRRSIKLDPNMWQNAVDLYIGFFHRPDMTLALAGDDVDQLHKVAGALRAYGKDATLGPTTGPATRPADETVAVEADERAAKLIREAADRPGASANMLGKMGMLCAQEGDPKGAILYLGKALSSDYGQVDWRLAKAQSLAKVGRNHDAIHEAQIILRQRPQMQQAQDLIDQLSKPTTQEPDELSR